MKKVIVIGGGAAGMMSAVAAADAGHKVTLIEKNEKLGKKIYITGKGRGNFTNGRDISEFFDNIVSNPKFLYSALYGFTNQQTMDFFEGNGMKWTEERGGRVFPSTNHASDITKALTKAMNLRNIEICLHTKALGLISSKDDTLDGKTGVTGVSTDKGEFLCDHVIVATGGLSYPTTGSTGDGLKFAKTLDIKTTDTFPALVALVTSDKDIPLMQGLSLKNVELSVYDRKKIVFSEFGEMLFTHQGISGPIVLSASAKLAKLLSQKSLKGAIDLKPKVDESKLNKRLVQLIEESPKKTFLNLCGQLLPRKMTEVFAERTGIEKRKLLCEITKDERRLTVKLLKEFPFTIIGTGGFKEAVITQGGIAVSQIDPGTMKAKNVEGLSFAGEVIDVDALTGGYNMQIAFSTGFLAGNSI